MKLPISHFRFRIEPAASRRGAAIGNRRAFSLVEILVVVSLLSVIILGLVAMFGQTQRAFRMGMTQTDVLEGGRMVTDLIRRELEQVAPSYLPRSGWAPGFPVYSQPNFMVWLPDATTPVQPLVQPLPGSSAPRTNLLGDLFFLTRYNQEWIGIGYFVRTNYPQANWQGRPVVGEPARTLGPGTLYRFETNAPVLSGRTPAQMYLEFTAAVANPYRASKIMDGVIHFRVCTFNTNSYWIVSNGDVSASGTQDNTDILVSASDPSKAGVFSFYSNAVPASVELELGILEDRAWERFKALPDPGGQLRYLADRAGRVHLFRLRVPIRNVDPLAYR